MRRDRWPDFVHLLNPRHRKPRGLCGAKQGTRVQAGKVREIDVVCHRCDDMRPSRIQHRGRVLRSTAVR